MAHMSLSLSLSHLSDWSFWEQYRPYSNLWLQLGVIFFFCRTYRILLFTLIQSLPIPMGIKPIPNRIWTRKLTTFSAQSLGQFGLFYTCQLLLLVDLTCWVGNSIWLWHLRYDIYLLWCFEFCKSTVILSKWQISRLIGGCHVLNNFWDDWYVLMQ